MNKKYMAIKATERYKAIKEEIEKNPFTTDYELANLFQVSIHTIRSDRKILGVPEVRKRIKSVASKAFGESKTLSAQEIIGDLIEIDLDKGGLSILDTTPEMEIKKSGIVRGHILFAQANTLANAIVDTDVALTGESHVYFHAPVRAGQRVLAKASVKKESKRKRKVDVIMKVANKVVFNGSFIVYCIDSKLAQHMNMLRQDIEKEKNQ